MQLWILCNWFFLLVVRLSRVQQYGVNSAFVWEWALWCVAVIATHRQIQWRVHGCSVWTWFVKLCLVLDMTCHDWQLHLLDDHRLSVTGSLLLFVTSVLVTSHLVDIIWAIKTVWSIRGKITRTVLCRTVYDSCPQWSALSPPTGNIW